MALIGDILVKFVADFAQFASSMTEASRQIGAFGTKLDEQQNTLQRHGNAISGVAKTLADLGQSRSVDQFSDKLDALGRGLVRFGAIGAAAAAAVGAVVFAISKVREIEDYALAVDKIANTYKITIDQAAALKAGAKDANLSLEEFAKIVLSLPGAIQQLGDVHVRQFGSVEKSVKEVSQASKDLSNAWNDFTERGTTSLVNTFGPLATHVLQDLTRWINNVDFAIRIMGAGFDLATAAAKRWMDSLPTGPGPVPQWVQDQTEAYRQRYANMPAPPQQQPGSLKLPPRAFQGTGGGLFGSQAPVQMPATALPFGFSATANIFGGLTPPDTSDAKRGGGGGRTDVETVQALTERYIKMRDAANEAASAVRSSIKVDADDLGLMVEAKQAAAEAVARLEAKGIDVPKEQLAALEQTIFLAKQAQAEQNRQLQYAKDAEATERKLGDSGKALERVQRDLGRQYATNRLSATAYNRALKEQGEAAELAALQAKRYDDSLESMAAGFEYAAKQYARSNDLFSQGAQVFTSFTDAMGQGLDALTGKSTKTFGQIASDFASMLAKMALQAATSSVFKWAFGALGGATAATTAPAGYADFSGGSLVDYFNRPRALGGPVDARQSYLVGENGPERFVPAVAGRIEPMRSSDNAGSVTVNLDMNQTQGAADPGAALEFGRRVRAAVVDVIAQEKRPGGTLYRRANA